MSVHYIIDGYNVVKQISSLDEKGVEEGRNRFIKFLEVYKPQGSLKNEVTVVFDGKGETSGYKKTSNINVIFTDNETADDKIKRMVKTSSNKKRIIVVSDDKEIRFFIRDLGAKPMSVKGFLSKVKIKPFDAIVQAKDKPHLTSEEAKSITTEMEKIWLHRLK